MIRLSAELAEGLVLDESGDLVEQRSALFDQGRRYRYAMTRCWAPERPQLVVIMLNPSTADALVDDPTTKKVRGFVTRHRRGHYGGYVVLNLFAWRSSSPGVLQTTADPVGPANDAVIAAVLDQVRGDKALVAWGAPTFRRLWQAAFEQRTAAVLGQLACHEIRPLCLAITGGGQPQHPLYIANDRSLIPYKARRGERTTS